MIARISSCCAETHARVGRHLEAAKLDQAKAPGRSVGGIELVDADLGTVGVAGDVDQQVAQQAVDEPRERLLPLARRRDLAERNLHLVEPVVAGLVDPGGLACRSDEEAGEEVAERRMALPVEDQRLQQVRPPQERRVERRPAADDDMVAAAGAGVLAVDHELVGTEA